MDDNSTADDEVAAAWFRKANRDLRAARVLAQAGDAFPEIALYQAQQAAEKAVKAFLAQRRQRNRKTHDIPVLLEAAEQLSPGFTRFSDDAGWLCDWAYRYRYPEVGGLDLPGEEDVARGIATAEAILAHVESIIAGQAS